MMINYKEEDIVNIYEGFAYVIVNIQLHAYDGEAIGVIRLLNVCTNETDDYTIWVGNEDFTSFYICLPTGDLDEGDPDINEVYEIDTFNLDLEFHKSLCWS